MSLCTNGEMDIPTASLPGLEYKPALRETLARLQSLFERRASDQVFVQCPLPTRALKRFAERYGEGFCGYPLVEDRIAFWDEHLAELAAVEDDSVPSAYLSEMDQGLYGGMLGGETQFLSDPATGWISSMVKPLLKDWSELDRLHFDSDNAWWQRYLSQVERYAAAASGKYGISHFILIDSLNFVFELVGATGAYLALDEHPEEVRRAVDMAFDLNVQVQETFFSRVPLLDGGTVSNMAGWVPGGRIVSESVDPFHMTNLAYFARWGREPIERMLRHFDGSVFHLHGNGRHLLEPVSALVGAKAIFMGDDRPYPPAFAIRHQLRQRAGDMPLVMQAEYDAFRTALNEQGLPGGILYVVSGAPDVATANRMMEQVRDYRAPQPSGDTRCTDTSMP